MVSVVHELSGLKPSSGHDLSQLESLGTQLLVAQTEVDEPT